MRTFLPVIFLLLLSGCTAGRIFTSAQLRNIELHGLLAEDSLTATQLCEQYPFIFNWDLDLGILRQDKSAAYLKDSLEYEKHQSIRYFLRKYKIYKYSFMVNNTPCQGFITRLEPKRELPGSRDLHLFLTHYPKPLKQPILVALYTSVPAPMLEDSSKTVFRKNTIKLITWSTVYSDLIKNDGDPLTSRSTRKYRISETGDVMIRSSGGK